MKLFDWQRNHNVGNSFFKSLMADYMHVFNKGPFMEGLLTNILNIIQRCSILDKKYEHVIGHLDGSLKEFQFWQTMHLSRSVRWANGISPHIKGFNTKKKLSLTTLGIESWKLYSLFVQIYFIIGTSGNILPNNVEWFDTYIPLAEDNTLQIQIRLNISKQILAAMGSVIELYHLLHCPSIAKVQLPSLNLIISNCRIQIELVNYIRACLYQVMYVRDRTVKSTLPEHYSTQISQLGLKSAANDTEVGESNHLSSKLCYERTSKRGSTPLREIAWHKQRQILAEFLFKIRVIDPEMKQLTDQEINQTTNTNLISSGFEFNYNMGYQQIRFSLETKKWRSLKCIETCHNNCSHKLKHSINLHPFINTEVLHELLIEFKQNCDKTSMEYKLLNRAYNNDPKVNIRLHNGLKVKVHENFDSKEYHIRANLKLPYNMDSEGKTKSTDLTTCQAFSFIEIKLEGCLTQAAKVLAILEFKRNKYDDHPVKQSALILIALMKYLPQRPRKTRFYPYDEISYQMDLQRLELHVIPLSAIIGPLFVISTTNTSCFETELLTKLNKTFYVISPRRMRNRNHCINYTFLNQYFPDTFLSEDKMNHINDNILPAILVLKHTDIVLKTKKNKKESESVSTVEDDVEVGEDENNDNEENTDDDEDDDDEEI